VFTDVIGFPMSLPEDTQEAPTQGSPKVETEGQMQNPLPTKAPTASNAERGPAPLPSTQKKPWKKKPFRGNAPAGNGPRREGEGQRNPGTQNVRPVIQGPRKPMNNSQETRPAQGQQGNRPKPQTGKPFVRTLGPKPVTIGKVAPRPPRYQRPTMNQNTPQNPPSGPKPQNP
jgi:hypothetical protein